MKLILLLLFTLVGFVPCSFADAGGGQTGLAYCCDLYALFTQYCMSAPPHPQCRFFANALLEDCTYFFPYNLPQLCQGEEV